MGRNTRFFHSAVQRKRQTPNGNKGLSPPARKDGRQGLGTPHGAHGRQLILKRLGATAEIKLLAVAPEGAGICSAVASSALMYGVMREAGRRSLRLGHQTRHGCAPSEVLDLLLCEGRPRASTLACEQERFLLDICRRNGTMGRTCANSRGSNRCVVLQMSSESGP